MNIQNCDCPEDWPADPPGLRLLDRSLRCGICQDIYTGPVVLVCGHSYCSRCIRDSLNVRLRDGQAQACPSCRVPCDQADLRPATHLREASQAWQAVRQLLLTHHAGMLQQAPAEAHAQQKQQPQQQQRPPKQQKTPNHVSATQQEKQQVHRRSLRHAAGPVLRRQRRAATDTSAATGLQHQVDAITISSNAEADSDGDGACSVASDAEFATVQDSGDPDWQDSAGSDGDVNKHRSSRQKVHPRPTAGKRKLHSGHSGSSAGDAGALSCSQPDAAAATGDEFEVRECKRPRSSNGPDKDQQQHKLQDLKQPGVASMQAGDQPVQQQEGQKLQQSGVKQQQQQQLLPGYVACPVCGLSVKQAFINTHVDSCLTRAGNTQPPAAAATAKKKHVPVALSGAAAAAADKTASRGSSHLVTSAAAAGSGHGGTAARRTRTRQQLEPPPKLCFELMKDKVLKVKLTSLGLSSEGDKKACVDRYTSFRSYILALRDDGKADISLTQAAADFTRQEKHKARAVSRPQSLGALAAAAPPLSGVMQSNEAKQSSACGVGADRVMIGVTDTSTVVDHSHAALIRETRARMALQKHAQVLQQDGTSQQPQDQCQQHGQQRESVVIGDMGVLRNKQAGQRQDIHCGTRDVQLVAAAVSGVEMQANGSQGTPVAPLDKQTAASIQKNVAMGTAMQQRPVTPESDELEDEF